MARSKNTKKDRILGDMKAIRGNDRKAHFESGGSRESWRGRHMVVPDKRKAANKRACRSGVAD